MREAGIRKGDTVLIDLGVMPESGERALVLTAYAALLVRSVFYEEHADLIRVEAAHPDVNTELYEPCALMIFGRVRRVETVRP
jgi:hypothetical protein